MATPAVQFDPHEHRYYLDGRELPSVTTVLSKQGLNPDWYRFIGPVGLDRGNRVHDDVALDLKLGLELEEVDDDIRDSFRHWQQFREAAVLVPWLVEWRSACPVYGYAGTLDFFGLFGPKGKTPRPALIDWKRAHEDPVHALQVRGGYLPLVEAWLYDMESSATDEQRELVERHGIRCYGLSLGKAHPWPTEFTDQEHGNARDVFRCALAVLHWRRAHGR